MEDGFPNVSVRGVQEHVRAPHVIKPSPKGSPVKGNNHARENTKLTRSFSASPVFFRSSWSQLFQGVAEPCQLSIFQRATADIFEAWAGVPLASEMKTCSHGSPFCLFCSKNRLGDPWFTWWFFLIYQGLGFVAVWLCSCF